MATNKGDYTVGDDENAVAVITRGFHMGETPVKAGTSISGSLHTENLGIEKIIGNVISNPNIRFLVVCVQKSNDTLLDRLSKLYMKMG